MGTPELTRSTQGHAAVHVNRRVRTRTHGGVGGRKGQLSLLPNTPYLFFFAAFFFVAFFRIDDLERRLLVHDDHAREPKAF